MHMYTERLALAVPPRLLAELRRASDARETTLSEFVRSALRHQLAAERRASAEREDAA